jgi:Cu+-exporting ATPase
MTLTANNAGRVSAAIYTALSLAAGLVFFVLTLTTGDYSWVSRIGGALWVFALTLVVLMPTVTPIVMARATGTKMQFAAHDHDAMLRVEMGMHEEPPAAEAVTDPVCGMEIDPAKAAGRSEHGGRTYYFCSPGCKASFDEAPEEYAAA